MHVATEVEPVARGIWLWHLYDRTVKADLFSTAITAVRGIYVIDPVPLTSEALSELNELGSIAGIVVTNENHERAAKEFARRFQVQLYDRSCVGPGLTAIAIDGAPPGEIAVHCEANGGTLVIGDALINFEPYGFAPLPAKYCSNAKLMRKSLPKLLDYSFERILFAHGAPIVSGARQRLQQLLQKH